MPQHDEEVSSFNSVMNGLCMVILDRGSGAGWGIVGNEEPQGRLAGLTISRLHGKVPETVKMPSLLRGIL